MLLKLLEAMKNEEWKQWKCFAIRERICRCQQEPQKHSDIHTWVQADRFCLFSIPRMDSIKMSHTKPNASELRLQTISTDSQTDWITNYFKQNILLPEQSSHLLSLELTEIRNSDWDIEKACTQISDVNKNWPLKGEDKDWPLRTRTRTDLYGWGSRTRLTSVRQEKGRKEKIKMISFGITKLKEQ